MRYFYDTEFIEDGRSIQLISIGIVAEDGREFYAVSRDFNPRHAGVWVHKNVLPYLPDRSSSEWMSLREIRDRVFDFLLPGISQSKKVHTRDKPELWAWVGAYDHLVLAQLWGEMEKLPPGMPRFTHELKQLWEMCGKPHLPENQGRVHDALEDARYNAIRFNVCQQFLAQNDYKISL